MSSKEIIARIKKHGLKFEIVIDKDKYLEYKEGKIKELRDILIGDAVFSDASKAMRAKKEDLEKAFGTTDFFKIAEEIIKDGEVQITTEERRKLIEEKRKRIVDMISKRCINPQTGKPHPPQRIEIAMEQANVHIDPFKNVEEQYKAVVEALRKILPLRVEYRDYVVRIPVEYAGKVRSVVVDMCTLKKEEWSSNYWYAEIEMLAAMEEDVFSKLNSITHGHVESKLLNKR